MLYVTVRNLEDLVVRSPSEWVEPLYVGLDLQSHGGLKGEDYPRDSAT